MAEADKTNTLLDLAKVTEPFNLETALQYMRNNGEFIRHKNDKTDIYMYRDVQKRPAVVNGRRQFVTVENVLAFDKWGSVTTSINLSDLFNDEFYIMKFDENGEPDWTDPVTSE